MGPDLGLIFGGWCLLSLDETVRCISPLLLGVPVRSRLLRELELWGKGKPGVPSPCHLIWSHVPPYSDAALAQGASQLGSCWGLQMLGEYFDRQEAKQHSEAWRTKPLFYASGLRCIPCLSPEQRIHRIFKRQCRASSYKTVPRLLGLTVS
jgi:hypothetical protein